MKSPLNPDWARFNSDPAVWFYPIYLGQEGTCGEGQNYYTPGFSSKGQGNNLGIYTYTHDRPVFVTEWTKRGCLR